MEIMTEIKTDLKVNNYLKLKEEIRVPIYHLNNMFLKSKEKVSYYYENLVDGTVIAFNPNMTFYAASTTKLLVCMYLYEQSLKDNTILEKELLYTEDYKKDESNIMMTFDLNTKHNIRDLIKYAIIESDNSAYKMLMEEVTVPVIKEYGNQMGATTTMVGKDHYGIVSPYDYSLYLKKLLELVKTNSIFQVLLDYMIASSVKIVEQKNVGKNKIANKYGDWDIAYHDALIVYDEEPFILCIFTQKGKTRDKKSFINKTAQKIYAIHQQCKRFKQKNR